MKYFTKFPQTQFLLYPATRKTPAKYISLVDITTNIRFIKHVLENIVLFNTYSVKDGETPEIVSELIYETPHLHWIIMLLNEMYDYRNDWLMDSITFEKYIIDKYGSIEASQDISTPESSGIYGYIDERGLYVDSDYIGATIISKYDYEMKINEAKRDIKLIDKTLLPFVLDQFNSVI